MCARDLLYRVLPKPRALRAAQFRADRAERILVLSKQRNPTFTYYLDERLKQSKLPVSVRDLIEPLEDLQPDGLFVVICRYVRPSQLLWLFRHRRRLAGIALFIDDDLAATVIEPNGAMTYRFYVWFMGILPLYLLNRVLTHVWASTPGLASRFSGTSVDLLAPYPPEASSRSGRGDTEKPSSSRLLIAFHATGAHDAEHEFLMPILKTIAKRYPDIGVEVVATGKLARLWRQSGISEAQLDVVAPMNWADYLSETSRRSFDIVLVPLLSNRTNDARADTKRIDVCRMGAAAIFSSGHVYESNTVAGEVLVENTAECWIDAISRLIDDEDGRAAVKNASLAALEKLRLNGSPDLPGLGAGIIVESRLS